MPLPGYQQEAPVPSSRPQYRRREVEDAASRRHGVASTALGETETMQSRPQPSHQDLGSASSPAATTGPSTAASNRTSKTGAEVAPLDGSPLHTAGVAERAQSPAGGRRDFTLQLPPYPETRPVKAVEKVGSSGAGCAEPDWHRRIKLFLDQIAAPSGIALRGVTPSKPRFSGT